MTTQKKFVLVDGSSYFFRAFHALPPLHNSKGEPTGAVYGVINMLRRLIKDYHPDYVAVVFDSRGKTFRDELFAEYKATREAMPDELTVQFKPMVEIIKHMGLPLLIIDGVEADDVIGTLAQQATKLKIETIISTGDKDMAQLVNPHVTLVNTMTNTVMDRQGVIAKFGIPPEKIIDYLTLIGDKVDNIPGIPNVGPKTAVKWLEEYGDLEGVIKHADQIMGKVGENLRQCLSQLPLCRTLVTIKHDLDLPQSPTDLSPQPWHKEKLIELFKQLEFKSWLNDLLSEKESEVQVHYETVLDFDRLEYWLKQLKAAQLFAFDTETTDLNHVDAQLVGVCFAVKPGEAAYIPLAHDYPDAPTQLTRDEVIKHLQPLLEDKKKIKVAQNVKYDISVLMNYGVAAQNFAFDTMLESYVLNSTATRHNMDTLALKYLGRRTTHFEDIAGKGVKQLKFNQIKLEQAAPYAAEDADITLQLHHALWPSIEKEKGLRNVFEKIEMPLVSVLAQMERTGVLIDVEKLNKQSVELSHAIEDYQQQAFQIAGEAFNLSSPKQIQEILFNKLKLPILQKTPTGQPSTSEEVLQELAHDFPLPQLILNYRSLSKLKSTYTDALPKQVNPVTGRVHTSYNQAVAATGRLSSTDPNLQNIPIRTVEGRRIRQAFIAPPGYKIISADYSQIELRIMAHLTDDPGLTTAFSKGFDIHKATAAEVLSLQLDDVTVEQRRSAKAINFGLIYGMSAFGLAKQLGIPREAAQNYVDLYFRRYPNVKKYMEKTRAQAHERGYVETIEGRRLYLPEINARNLQRQRAAERAAINAPLQGSAADIIKLAMIQLDLFLQTKDFDARMIMQVHDELVFEVAEDQVDQVSNQVRKLMCHTVELSVPLEVEIGVGDNWGDAH